MEINFNFNLLYYFHNCGHVNILEWLKTNNYHIDYKIFDNIFKCRDVPNILCVLVWIKKT